MLRISHSLPLLVVLAAWACADSTGPPVDLEQPEVHDRLGAITGAGVPEGDLHIVRHDIHSLTTDGQRGTPSQSALMVDEALPYQVSFWAVAGEEAVVSIQGQGTGDAVARELLWFQIPAGGLLERPDGSVINAGDSVLISVDVDPAQLLVHLEPSGLVFNASAPARLKLWYGSAGGDLDGDGDVDEDDDAIRQNHLGQWFQQDVGDHWYPIYSIHNTEEEWFLTHLYHFSGYSVSW